MTEVAADQLKTIVQRVERLEGEIADLNADKSEIYKEARANGFDVKIIKKVVSKRKLDSHEREEQDNVFELYWDAVHGSGLVHTRTRENIELSGSLDINPRLAKQIVDGMQTEAGRAALVAAVDIMIERVDEEEQNTPSDAAPRLDTTVNAPDSDGQIDTRDLPTNSPETARETPSAGMLAQGREVGDGSPSIVSEGLDPSHQRVDAAASLNESDDDAISEVNGEAGLENVVDVEPSSSGQLSEQPQAGGDHVTASDPAPEAGALVNHAPAHKPLRPLCKHPGSAFCGGYGSTHCSKCLVAMKEGEAA